VLARMKKGKLTKDDVRRLAHRVYLVPEGALLHRQLLNFQDENHRVGLVVDEYGDIQGLVSLQDVLEEIVGEFSRDLDDVMMMIQPQKDGSFMVDGRISLRDLNRQTHWNLPTEGPKTLSGLLIDFLEMIPAPGIAARVSGYPMEVKEMSGNTVRLVQVWPSLSPQSAHEK